MKYLSSKFCSLSRASAFVSNLPAHASKAIVCICFISTLLVACGGSSSSEAVSNSQVTTPVDGNFTEDPPPDTQAPDTGINASNNLGNTPQVVIDQCMSDVDKEMLTHVNAARSQARNCGNVNYPATNALSWHCTLEDVAYVHSRDMGDHNFFSHTGSDGLTPGDRVRNAGYDWSAVGENIAAGQQSIDTVMTAWLDSPGHCANIMNSSYTEYGAASYTVSGSDYSIYWTQIFARPDMN
ncbi:MAG: CAP domain-containing protein [Gammaproteobacteria bacterium]